MAQFANRIVQQPINPRSATHV